MPLTDRKLQKRINFAMNYGASGTMISRLNSRPPKDARCMECQYSMPGNCPECMGTYRKQIPMAEVIQCRS